MALRSTYVTHPLDDLSTPALKRSCAVHRYTDTRMRGPCPEGAASTVDFYIIFLRNVVLAIAKATANGHVPVHSIASESRIWCCQVPGHRRLPFFGEVLLGTILVNRSNTERRLTAYYFYHFCYRDNSSVIGDTAPDTSDAWL